MHLSVINQLIVLFEVDAFSVFVEVVVDVQKCIKLKLTVRLFNQLGSQRTSSCAPYVFDFCQRRPDFLILQRCGVTRPSFSFGTDDRVVRAAVLPPVAIERGLVIVPSVSSDLARHPVAPLPRHHHGVRFIRRRSNCHVTRTYGRLRDTFSLQNLLDVPELGLFSSAAHLHGHSPCLSELALGEVVDILLIV